MKKAKNVLKKRNWSDSEFTSQIRLKPDKLDYIKATKGKLTAAGRLDQILEDYLKMEIEQKGGAIE